MKVNKKQFLEGIIDKVFNKIIAAVNAEKKKKGQDIINLKDPKSRRIANKYRKQIAKQTSDLLKVSLKHSR
tara:strand:- start:76 stop:288 length:213 start_codon:yes stop_codon:yes gene_type:complete